MKKDNIIGREKERSVLEELYKSDRSEFIAMYGRRRVGKTFLIKELFASRYTFQMTGLSKGNIQLQLTNFFAVLTRYAPQMADRKAPTSWFEAFQLLIAFLEQNQQKRKVVFIDELPWLDTPKSDFITALEHFWNGWAFHRNDIFLIVCGSATSWIINELINNHGGLHNRLTGRIHLKPFNLKETELFLQSRGSAYDRYQIVQLYMAMGGVPFYLENVDVKKSVAQNIDALFYQDGGVLKREFHNLYRSLFKGYERHIKIIESLAAKAKGLSRSELLKATKLANGGGFTRILKELEECGFITPYIPFGKKKRDAIYQLSDPYSLFYLKFIEGSKAKGPGAWLTQIDQPKWRAWSGYAFETICLYHIVQIKRGLEIGAVYTEISSWRSKETENGAQIDLVLDRRDRVINLCEIKFSQAEFVISKSYAANLRNKIDTFRQETGSRKSLFLTMITTFGLKENMHVKDLVQNELSMEMLFGD